MAIYENPGFQVSKPGVSQSQDSIRRNRYTLNLKTMVNHVTVIAENS